MMYGADSDQLDGLASSLDAAANELSDLLRQSAGEVALATLSTTLMSIWRGPRASDFGNIWQARHLYQLNGLEQMLRDAAQTARSNAAEQRITSGTGSQGETWSSTGGDGRELLHESRHWGQRLVPYLGPALGLWETGEQIMTGLPYFRSILALGGSKADAFEVVLRVGRHSGLTKILGRAGNALAVFDYVDNIRSHGVFDGRTYESAVSGGGGYLASLTPAGPLGGLVFSSSMAGTDFVLDRLDNRFDYTGAFIDSVVAREGKVPDYDGAAGFGRWAWDGVQNAFGSW